MRIEMLRTVDRGMKVFQEAVLNCFEDELLSSQEVIDLEKMGANFSSRIWIRITTRNGKVVHESKGFPSLLIDESYQDRYRSFKIDRDEYRIMDCHFNDYKIRTVGSLSMLSEIQKDLIGAFSIALPLSILAIGGGCWILVQKSLSSLTQFAEIANLINAENLSYRLPVPESRDEIQRLSEFINEMLDRLERGFYQARRFTADASHQLKTPLTVIRGELEALLRSGQCNQIEIVRILERVSHLSAIIERLLFLSRIESSNIQLLKKPFNISEILCDLDTDFSAIASARGIHWNSAIAPGIWVNGDAHMINQLLVNILENAVKYNNRGGMVDLSARAIGQQLVVIVKNSGPEIMDQDKEKIFDRFHRGSAATTFADGHGLGLNISREIAKIHGGTVELESSSNDATVFCVHLPLFDK
jgi:signal transduction histidine kinase